MYILKYFDIFETKFHFYLNGQPTYQNRFGGLMSFFFLFLSIFSFIIFSYDDLRKLNPISSKSEIPDAGMRTVNIHNQKIWIPFRMVTYEEQFVDHRGILFPQIFYVEGKWDNNFGMNLKYHLLNYSLCNETSMAEKPDSYKINVPLNELFCIQNDDLDFGGSWNGNYLHYLEYNLHLCEDGINFNETDPKCTNISELLKHRQTSWLFEFYYPVVQFQPTNYDTPLAVIYRSYFYRLATYNNKVERIYISQHILSDDKSIIYTRSKNSSCWGMSLLYGDDYYMRYEVDPLVKSTSSRLYSLDIYMDIGMVYYTRCYKTLFLIIADFFPILKLILFFTRRITEHIKMSKTKQNLAEILFEKTRIKNKKNYSKNFEQISLNKFKSINLHSNNNFNNKREFIQEERERKNSDSDIIRGNINLSNNKSNVLLNNENAINILNRQEIIRLNSNNPSIMIYKDNKQSPKHQYKSRNSNREKKNTKFIFPYYYFLLDIIFDKLERPKTFCGISKKYFLVYKFMGQIYDISTHVKLLRQFNILNSLFSEKFNKLNNGIYPYEIKTKININDNYLLEKIEKELDKENHCLLFSNTLFI